MSVRDQRVGTSYSDKVREDVSLEYVTLSKRKRVGWKPGQMYSTPPQYLLNKE